jgi:hypothetical protein
VGLQFRPARGPALELFARRDYREAGDVPESSLLMNSLAAQEFGTDRTDPYDVRAVGVGVELGAWRGVRFRLEGSHELQGRLAVHATPWDGHYEPTIPAWSLTEERLALWVERPTALAVLGTELRVRGELRGGWLRGRDTTLSTGRATFARAFAEANVERRFGDDRLVLRTTAAVVSAGSEVPPQEYIFLGGPVTGPGYDFHRFAARFGASERVEWRTRVPFVPISLGPFGRSPASATLAPYLNAVYVSDAAPFAAPARGWYPSVGVGLFVLFDVLRFDVARGLRDGGWTFSVDVMRELWGAL